MEDYDFQRFDWVVLGENTKSEGEIAHILSIGDGEIYSNYVGLIGTHNLCHSFEECIDDIRPLPLTTDVCEANLWEKRIDNDYRTVYEYYEDDNIVEISFSKVSDSIFLRIYVKGNIQIQMPIEYVSDLQHSLNLVKMRKLSRTIKVNRE